MSYSQNILYDDPSDFTFDASKLDIVSTLKMKLQTQDTAYAENFTSDAGFTYNSALCEFLAGLLQQKDQIPADAQLGIRFIEDKLVNWARSAYIEVDVGTTTIHANGLDLTGGGNEARVIDGVAIGACGPVGTIEFDYTPNYNLVPAGSYNLVALKNPSNNNDNLIISHAQSGDTIRGTVYNSAGLSILSAGVFGAAQAFSSGTTYKLAVTWNWVGTNRYIRLWRAGALWGNITTASMTRGTSATSLYVGAGVTYPNTDCWIKNVRASNTELYTVPYTPSYTVPVARYLENYATCPALSHAPSLGGFVALQSLTAVITGNARFTLRIDGGADRLYHNGAAWIASSRTYATASPAADFNTYKTTLPISGNSTLEFEVYFPNAATQSTIDSLTATIQEEYSYPVATAYPCTVNSGVLADEIYDLDEVANATPGSSITYALEVSGVKKYFNTTSLLWETTTGYPNTNTLAEVQANVADLDILLGDTVKLMVYLYSDTGAVTPELTSNELEYSFYATTGAVDMTTLFGYVMDGETPVENAVVTFKTSEVNQIDDKFITVNELVYSRATGYFDADLPEGAAVTMKIVYTDALGKKQSFSGSFVVPAVATNVEDLV